MADAYEAVKQIIAEARDRLYDNQLDMETSDWMTVVTILGRVQDHATGQAYRSESSVALWWKEV